MIRLPATRSDVGSNVPLAVQSVKVTGPGYYEYEICTTPRYIADMPDLEFALVKVLHVSPVSCFLEAITQNLNLLETLGCLLEKRVGIFVSSK